MRRRGASVMLRVAIVCAASMCAATSAFAATYTRTWVSGKGVDSTECGPIASPCRTLQRAYFNTNAGGEVNILDGAGYGSLDITKAISIVNDGAGVAGVLASAGSPGINISTGLDDSVVLRGLTIEGAGVGSNGIRFTNGGSLTISNVNIQGFTATNGDGSSGNGIYLRPGSGQPRISISNANISDNGNAGILFRPNNDGGGRVAIDRLITTNNKYGLSADATNAATTTFPIVTNSVATNNSFAGFHFEGGAVYNAFVRTFGQLASSQAGGNLTGLIVNGNTKMVLSGCTIAGNLSVQVSGTGQIQSIGNNSVFGSASLTPTPLTPY